MIRLIDLSLISILLCSPVYSQWEIGASYNLKDNLPEKGFGVSAGRNLPFQWPLIGFMVRAEGNFYSSDSKLNTASGAQLVNIKQADIDINLIGTFYPRYIQPYAGLGIGISSFSYKTSSQNAEEVIHTKIKKYPFFIDALAGIRFSLFRNFYPFAAVSFIRYFSSFGEKEILNNISSFQLCGYFGLKISFDTE